MIECPESRGATRGGQQDNENTTQTFSVSPEEKGLRLDRFLVLRLNDSSRSALSKAILSGHVVVNDRCVKSGHRLHAHDQVVVRFPRKENRALVAEPIDFTVLFEDDFLLVISKPPGLVVHPAAGHHSGTLVNGLLHHCESLAALDPARPGIVHRLDKETSGIMLVGKTEAVLRQLSADFKDRKVEKVYHALLLRCPSEPQGRLIAPVGRHPVHRQKMAVRPGRGRYAVTNWQIVEHLPYGMCFAQLSIETGRTHQIRVHMASLGAPVAGDKLYGGRLPVDFPISVERQLLHASSIRFNHPVSGLRKTFNTPLWPDMQTVLDALREKN